MSQKQESGNVVLIPSPIQTEEKKSLKSLFLDFFLSQHQGSEVIIERGVWFQVFLVCYSKEGRGFAFPGLQRSPSSLPAPSAFSRNISVCRVPLSTSFLILCREGKHRDAQGNSFSGPNHRGDPSENANAVTGQGEATEGALEHQAAPKHGILPVMCHNSCLWQQEGISRLQHRFLGICGCMETMGCRNFGTQRREINCHKGFKPTGLQTKEMGSTEETGEPRSCL